MGDDKAPWERLLEKRQMLQSESARTLECDGFAQKVRSLAHLQICDAIASLERCGMLSAALADQLLATPSPSGVSFNQQQKRAALELLETRQAQVQPGGTATVHHHARHDSLTGKQINAFEVNALQSGALVKVQFSSKEGFGLTVSESLVKSLPCRQGLTICTLVGGMQLQAEACECFKITYPTAEVVASLRECRALPDQPTIDYLQSLSLRIASRASTAQLRDFIRTAATLPRDERLRRRGAARKAVLANCLHGPTCTTS